MPELPVGTVTFLFKDIEGSTRLWERNPEEMGAALPRHDALLRAAFEQNGGAVFATGGDAFCAAFPTAAAALSAVRAAQRALAAEPWPESARIKVRMALHAGAAEVRDGDYFGQPLNHVARLLSAGHGGQILLSLATQEQARDALPAGVTLRDLGDRRLKDLIRPEHVFQLVAPDLPSDFPSLNTLDSRTHNLPIQPAPAEPARRGLRCRWVRTASTPTKRACGWWSSPRSATRDWCRRWWPRCSASKSSPERRWCKPWPAS